MATVQRNMTPHLQRLNIEATRAYVDSGLRGIEAEVVIALDVAAPMAPLYITGTIQELVTWLLALGMKFDDDGVVPAYVFSEGVVELEPLSLTDLDGWVSRVVVPVAASMPAGCRYGPIIEAVGQRYFPREWETPAVERAVGDKLKRRVRVYPSLEAPRDRPIFVIVVTAGDCADHADAARALRRASHLPIFWQFAGITPPGQVGDFAFLDRIDGLDGRHVDNCGVFQPAETLAAKSLFEGLLNAFPRYLDRPEVGAMLGEGPDAEDVDGQVAGGTRTRGRPLRRTGVPRVAGAEDDGAPRRRLHPRTQPYQRGDAEAQGMPAPAPQAPLPEDPEERLAQIRARRAARRARLRDRSTEGDGRS